MVQLLRKAVGLIAAYAIALQALLSGGSVATHINTDGGPFSIICTSDMARDTGSPPQREDHDCGLCILTCGGTPALTVPSTAILLIVFFERVRRSTLWLEALPSPLHHQPQA